MLHQRNGIWERVELKQRRSLQGLATCKTTCKRIFVDFGVLYLCFCHVWPELFRGRRTFLPSPPALFSPCTHTGSPFSRYFSWLVCVVLPGYLRVFLHFPLAIWHFCYFVFPRCPVPYPGPFCPVLAVGSGCVVVLGGSGIYCFWRQLLHFFHLPIHFHFLSGWLTSRVLSIFNSLFGQGIKLTSYESWPWESCQRRNLVSCELLIK